MGQQQLLLIILAVIVVGIAIAVGISMFSGQQGQTFDYSLQLTNMADFRQMAEKGRDTTSGKYLAAVTLIKNYRNYLGVHAPHLGSEKFFVMASPGLKFADPGMIGVWTCPTDTNLLKISAFGTNGELIGTTDNFNEVKPPPYDGNLR